MSRIAKPSEHSSGTYFKPKDYQNALVLLIEAKEINHDVPNEYRGVQKVRDEVSADITVFNNERELDAGEPAEVLTSCLVVHGMLTSTLSKVIGMPMAAKIELVETRNGSGYVFRDVDLADEGKAGAYYDKREEAIAAAIADAPDFD